jgi:hypothetical protein
MLREDAESLNRSEILLEQELQIDIDRVFGDPILRVRFVTAA